MVRRRRKREKRNTPQHGCDALRFADVAGDVVGFDALDGERFERQVQQAAVRVLGVALQGVQCGVRCSAERLLARGYDPREPVFTERVGAVCAFGERGEGGGEERRDWVGGRAAGKGGAYGVAPEGEAHGADCWGGDCVGDVGEFEVEGADGEVGGLGSGGDEGEEGIGGGVIFAARAELVGGSFGEGGRTGGGRSSKIGQIGFLRGRQTWCRKLCGKRGEGE